MRPGRGGGLCLGWSMVFSIHHPPPVKGVQRAPLMKKLDSIKVQTLGAISESINQTRHCTAASYTTIRWDTDPRGVYLSTEPVSRRLAASASKPDCTSAFLRCVGQLVAKGK